MLDAVANEPQPVTAADYLSAKPQTEQPSRKFGTADITAGIIKEREAANALRIAAVELKAAATRIEAAAFTIDELTKQAFAKGVIYGMNMRE